MKTQKYQLMPITDQSGKFAFATEYHQTGIFETKVDAFVTIIDLLYEYRITPNHAGSLAVEVLEHQELHASELRVFKSETPGVLTYEDEDSDYYNLVMDACDIRTSYNKIEEFPIIYSFLGSLTNLHAIILLGKPIFRKDKNEFHIIIPSSVEFYCKEHGFVIITTLFDEGQINLIEKEKLLNDLEDTHIPEQPLEYMN
jgi:hypothetical protein